MIMEAAAQAQEEAILGSNSNMKDQSQIMKGKRTKRQRLLSPLSLAMPSSSSSTGGGDQGLDHHHDHLAMAASSTSSAGFTESTEEEEDMANCLILLAQGGQTAKPTLELGISGTHQRSSSKFVGGLYGYQCKTCNKCFSSFQALGGHRASHKKPKSTSIVTELPKKSSSLKMFDELEDLGSQPHFIKHNIDNNNSTTTLSLQIANRADSHCGNNKSSNKVHECSICGVEFSSGQALGGHMRRHRTTFVAGTTTTTTTTTSTSTADTMTTSANPEFREAKKPRTALQLDLNLPAPAEESKFPFVSSSSKEQVLVFSASALVDCHY